MEQVDSTSWHLIQGAAAGEEAPRAEFARRYEPLIRAFLANRWRSTDLVQRVEDSVQEVFLECFRFEGVLKKANRDRPGGFRAFLYGVVRNVALRVEDRQRRNREHQPDSGFEPERPDEELQTPSQQMDREWARAILRTAVELMVERARAKGEEAQSRVEILRLRLEDRVPIREIAKRWQVELIPLHQQYMKASREFKSALREVLFPGVRVSDDLLQRGGGEDRSAPAGWVGASKLYSWGSA